jgi:hypothetical protein
LEKSRHHDHRNLNSRATRALRGRSRAFSRAAAAAPTAKKMPLTRPGPSTGANSTVLDLYETPAAATEALLRIEWLPHLVWELAAGRGIHRCGSCKPPKAEAAE